MCYIFANAAYKLCYTWWSAAVFILTIEWRLKATWANKTLDGLVKVHFIESQGSFYWVTLYCIVLHHIALNGAALHCMLIVFLQNTFLRFKLVTKSDHLLLHRLFFIWYQSARDRVVFCWLLNVPATCECISVTDRWRQFYVLLHWNRSCRSNSLPHPVTVYWHRADQSHWPYNARYLAG